jgi:CheY-like chemotaxis protein
MKSFPLITDKPALRDTVLPLLETEVPEETGVEVTQLDDPILALDFLNIEMPDLAFIDFSASSFDAFALLDRIMADPWLLHAGLIALCEDYDVEKRLNDLKGTNIIVVLRYEMIDTRLPKVMSIVRKNRRILFQRSIGAELVDNISGSFKLDNDLLEVSVYANLICNFLYNANKIDGDTQDCLNMALNEMLINAIEHGNCGIDYEAKSAFLEQGGDIGTLIRQRCQDPVIAARRATFEYTLTPDRSRFLIADEGEGFDWRAVKNPASEENILALHGRGILMINTFTKNMRYNEKGNEVQFEIKHQRNAGNTTPGLFRNMTPLDVEEGQEILHEGESSTYLYYIVKGTYDILVGGNVVSTLTADDMFMGEMSFLLNNRRSASVRARTPGRLIKVSKTEFIEAIKKKPHYALFLARLLAQRIQRFNLRSSGR